MTVERVAVAEAVAVAQAVSVQFAVAFLGRKRRMQIERRLAWSRQTGS
jgi:hypothetical protein